MDRELPDAGTRGTILAVADGSAAASTCALPGSDRPPITLQLTKPGRLPVVCRDRIAASVIATRRVTIASGPVLITVHRRIDHAIKALRADLGI